MDEVHLPYQVLAQVILRRFKLTKNIKSLTSHNSLFIKNWNKENSHFCSRVPYQAPFLPRDKRSNNSSFEKTSLEVVWIEWKIQSKREGKAEQRSIYFLLKTCTSDPLSNVFSSSERREISKMSQRYGIVSGIDITRRYLRIYKERYFQPLN